MVLLGIAIKDLPVGTAYAVWVGIGVLGTFAVGLLALGEPFSWARMGFVSLLLIGIVGLKMTTP